MALFGWVFYKAARRCELVGDMCSMLPYATGIIYAFRYMFKKKVLVMFVTVYFTLTKYNLVLINLTKRSTIPAYPSFSAIAHKINIEETIFRNLNVCL